MLALIVIAIIVVLAVWTLFVYNRLVAMRQHCSEAFANIDVLLKQRHDLIPNLVETVQGYASHERGTFDVVVQARNAAVAAQGPAARADAESALTSALRQLFALSENYPNLKANANFQQLQADLTGIESKIASARRAFNSGMQGYNTTVQQFPAALFSGAFGFTPQEYFEARESREVINQAPAVKF